MSTTQDIESEIEKDRQRAIAAGLSVPDIPRTPSYGNRLSDLYSYRRWTLGPLLRRIGSAPMENPRLTPAQAKDCGGTERSGYRFSFPQYPGVEWFVYRGPHLWHVIEYSTGMAAGQVSAKCRSSAIAGQWDVLENMRTAKNNAGGHQSVIAYVKERITEKQIINQ